MKKWRICSESKQTGSFHHTQYFMTKEDADEEVKILNITWPTVKHWCEEEP